MRLAQTILNNEKSGESKKNTQLVRIKLKELVTGYPDEILEVLQKTGVQIKSVLPPNVLLAIIIKHIHKNSKLREAISKMLLEMDGFHRADGQWTGIVGGALTAIGSVLTGIGRGQLQNTDQQRALEEARIRQMQQQADQERRRRTTTWIVIGGLVLLTGIALAIRQMNKAKNVQPKIQPA